MRTFNVTMVSPRGSWIKLAQKLMHTTVIRISNQILRMFLPFTLDSRINMTRLVPQLRVLHKSQPA